MQKILLSLIICLQTTVVFSQKKFFSKYDMQFNINPTAGVYVPLNRLLTGGEADNLIRYNDRSWYHQDVLSYSFFFNKHWGISLNMHWLESRKVSRQDGRFTAQMQTAYGDNYYVSDTVGGNYSQNRSPTIGYLGIIYKMESNRFYWYPKLSVGYNTFDAEWRIVHLKKKNSNELMEVVYQTDYIGQSSATITPSLAFGVKLTRRIYVGLEVLASYNKVNFAYTKTTTNVNTGKVEEAYIIPYKKNLWSMAFGAGITFAFKGKKRGT